MKGELLHGGRLADACVRFGGDTDDWLDLSTGINPVSWPGADQITPDWRRLPDPCDLARLEAQAADYFKISREFVCAVPGSEMALRLLATLFALPACHRPPCYGTHVSAFASSQAVTSPDHLPAQPCVMVMANPNNPDGEWHSATSLHRWHDRLAARDGWLILDEAFADAMMETGPGVLSGVRSCLAGQVRDDRRWIVLRSFGKFFGLAGIRLGFVIAPRAIIARLRGQLGEWPLNAAALTIGIGAYADTAWIEQQRQTLDARAARLDAILSGHTLVPIGACPLFRMVETAIAPALFTHCAGRQILTRAFTDHPHRLRFGLPDEAGFARLQEALHDFPW